MARMLEFTMGIEIFSITSTIATTTISSIRLKPLLDQGLGLSAFLEAETAFVNVYLLCSASQPLNFSGLL